MIGRELLRNNYSICSAARELKIDHATLLYGIKTLGSMGSDKTRGWQLEIDIERQFKTATHGKEGINEKGAARP